MMADDNLKHANVEKAEANDKDNAKSEDKFRDEVFGAGKAGAAIADSVSKLNQGDKEKDGMLPKLDLGQEANRKDQDRVPGENNLKNAAPNDAKSSAPPHPEEAHKSDQQSTLPNDANSDKFGKMPGDLADKLKDALDNLDKNQLDKHLEEEVKDGVEELPTGDHIVREDGKETLFTPNGDRISLNPDGSNTIKGDVKKVETDKDGVTTVTFGDGAEVSFDEEGFRSVTRGDQGISFGRMGHGGGGGKGGGGDIFDKLSPGAQNRINNDMMRIEKIAPGLLEKEINRN